MVDSRYHRSPDKVPDNDKKRMLGDAQFSWLLEGLRRSKARFKVIVSGSTLNHSKSDGWRIYTFSRHRLFDALKKHAISGVMHVRRYPQLPRLGASRIRTRWLSSGGGHFLWSGQQQDTQLCHGGFRHDPARSDRSVRIVYGDGTIRADKTWKLSQLGPKQ